MASHASLPWLKTVTASATKTRVANWLKTSQKIHWVSNTTDGSDSNKETITAAIRTVHAFCWIAGNGTKANAENTTSSFYEDNVTTTKLEGQLLSLPKIKFNNTKLKQELSELKGVAGVIEKLVQITSILPKVFESKVGKAVVAVVPFLAFFVKSIPYLEKATHTMSTLVNWINDRIDVPEAARQEMAIFFAKYDVHEDENRSKGILKQFKTSISFLNGFKTSEKISEGDIKALSGHVPIYQGVEFIGILEDKLVQMMQMYDASKDTRNMYQMRQILEYMDLYLRLTDLRRIILLKMFYIIKESGYCSAIANGVLNIICENDISQNFSILRKPSNKNVHILAVIDPEESEFLHMYMTSQNMYQELNEILSSSVKMRTTRWKNWYLVPSKSSKYVKGKKQYPEKGNFHFEEACTGNYFFWKTEDNKYLRMEDGSFWLTYAERKPGNEGMFKIIRLADNTYKISPRKWPTKFVRMSGQRHACLYGHSGPQSDCGQWEIRYSIFQNLLHKTLK